MLTIWLDAWQMTCCGEPFHVGSEIRWTLYDELDDEWLAAVLGQPLAGAVTHAEDHHDAAPGIGIERSVRVLSIRAVSCRYGRRSGRSGFYPIAETGELRERSEVHGARPSETRTTTSEPWRLNDGDRRFVGYLVEAEAL